jgi:beta-aspartyl-peptidase (threonine type)
MTTRRKFLGQSLLGAFAASDTTFWSKALQGTGWSKPKSLPLVIATWDNRKATQAAWDILSTDGRALDAVEAGARIPEADPLDTSVGYGGFPDRDGHVTLDACIMDEFGMAGSVCFLENIMHPISVARKVMEKTPHVFLIGDGADQFAREQGLEQVPNTFFLTARRWQILEEVLTEQKMPIPPKPAGLNNDGPVRSGPNAAKSGEARFGTIGIVVRDTKGVLVAGTSTGGLTGKKWGRVGDVPVIGAGTYATLACAVSGTGTGEYFIRLGVARAICDKAAEPGMDLQAAADAVMKKDLTALGGDGGVIVVNARGQTVSSMNTPGMYRAQMSAISPARVAIYADEN